MKKTIAIIFFLFSFCSISSDQTTPIPYIYNSVNVITGAYCEAQTDAACDDFPPLSFCRSYDGASWSFNHPNFYQPHSTHSYEIVASDGRHWLYDFDPNNPALLEKFTRPDGSSCRYRYGDHPMDKQRKLIIAREESDGDYLLNEYYDSGPACGKIKLQKAPLGADDSPIVMHRFTYGNGCTEVYDALNHKVVYRYSQAQRLTAIEQYDDQQTLYRAERFFWDETHTPPRLLFRVILDGCNHIQMGRSFSYDAEGNITKETLHGNLSGNHTGPILLETDDLPATSEMESYSTHYEYSTQQPNLPLKQIEDNGLTTRFVYHPANKKLAAKLVGENNRISMRHFYLYDEYGVLIQTIVDDGETEDQSDLNKVTERHITKYISPDITEKYYLDLDSREEKLLKRTCKQSLTENEPTPEKIDAANAAYTRQCDFLGNTIQTLDRRGNATTYAYDEFGRLTTTVYPAVLTLLNEAECIVSPMEQYEYDIFNNVTAKIDPNGQVTHARYNIRGKPIEILYPGGARETFEYHLDGTLRQSIAKNGVRTVYHTDYLARVVGVECFDALGRLHSGSSTAYSTFRQLSAVDPQGTVTTYSYDGAGRKIACAICAPHETRNATYAYDEAPTEGAAESTQRQLTPAKTLNKPINESLFQNDRGQFVLQTETVDGKGCMTITTFDALDRVESVKMKNSLGKLIACQTFRYDPTGNKIKETHDVFQGDRLLRAFAIRWRYGPENRLESITEAVGSPQQTTSAYQYDDCGRLQNLIKPDGVFLTYEYDALGRVGLFYSTDHSFRYRYQYDLRHQVIQAIDEINGVASNREYNAFQQMTSETLANGLTVANNYDEQGRRIQLILPDESSVEYVYDDLHLKAAHRFSADRRKLYSHHFTAYNDAGQLSTAELIGELGEVHYQYDARNRLTEITSPYWSAAIPENGRDQTDNVIAISGHASAEPYSIAYLYDNQNHLIEETGATSRSYAYDSLGNRISKNRTNYLLDDRNRLLADSEASYSYNVNGCLIEKTSNGNSERYQYDALNRLTSIIQSDYTIAYLYDAFGRRLLKKNFNHETKEMQAYAYLYDGEDEIGAATMGGELFELRILGLRQQAERGAAIALELSGRIYAPLHDLQGSISCLIDMQTGSVAEYYNYSAFGEALVSDGVGHVLQASDAIAPWRFAGKRYDKESSLIYFGKRYYDPSTGRWITPDPLGFIEGANLYAYAGNNPLYNRDLYGLFSFSDFWSGLTSAIESFFQTIFEKTSQTIHYLQNQFSLSNHIQPHLDQIAQHLFGKTSLSMMGFYSPEPLERGVCGHGELGNHIRITAINGILNLREHCDAGVALLSNAHGGVNVHYVFYPSEGWTRDLFNVILAKFGYVTPHAKLLAATWKDLIQEMGGTNGGGLIIHYAHSIGGTNTEIAKSLLTPEEQRMIRVITIGSATAVSDSGFESVTNYISHRDGVILADLFGYFHALVNHDSHVVCVGSKWDGVPLIDHLLTMETYRRLIEALGQEFCTTYGVLTTGE